MNSKVEFTAEATKPNIATPSSYDPDLPLGLTLHENLEQVLVKPYSQLKVKQGWILKGESFCEGMGGYGKVEGWNEEGTKQVDPMDIIEGDFSPISYLQAAMLYRDMDEFGRYWHSTQWGVEEVIDHSLALEKGLATDEDHDTEEEHWTFTGKRPVNWNPTYTEREGIVKITYYSINPVDIETLIHNSHTFEKDGYVEKLRTKRIASGMGGIIF